MMALILSMIYHLACKDKNYICKLTDRNKKSGSRN